MLRVKTDKRTHFWSLHRGWKGDRYCANCLAVVRKAVGESRTPAHWCASCGGFFHKGCSWIVCRKGCSWIVCRNCKETD